MLSDDLPLILRAVPSDLYQKSSPKKNLEGNESVFSKDEEFDWLYPENYQALSLNHWTPLPIARRAGNFLSLPGSRVLDIGSGIGKFCLTAAHYHPGTEFYGVEQREDLVHFARQTQEYTGIQNVKFIHANITGLDFSRYDHFYFFNSFYENLDEFNRIDDEVDTSAVLHEFYTRYLVEVFTGRPVGTRLVTYHSQEGQVPANYSLMDTSADGLLKMWIKTT